jgi:hypothetical protein
MLDILQRCFADDQRGLIQSVIRVNHIKSDVSMINPTVRQIWSTFTETVSLVKKYVQLRPNLNMIECAILSERGTSDKTSAIFVAISQCILFLVLAWHVLIAQKFEQHENDNAQCDALSVLNDIVLQNSLKVMLGCGYFEAKFSGLITIIAVMLTYIKMKKQVQDQYYFYVVFKQLIKGKQDLYLLNIILLLQDVFVNVIMSFLLVLFTGFLISKSEKELDLVLNCLAITFIVELDETLNHRDPVEVNDLVIQSFKNYLIRVMMRESEEINSSKKHFNDETITFLSFFDNFMASKSTVNWGYLSKQLVSADYCSDSQTSYDVLPKVKSCIEEGRLLPVLNDRFYGDPDPGKPKFLVLRFRNEVTIHVKERLVVDFEFVENIVVRRKNLEFSEELFSRKVSFEFCRIKILIENIFQYSTGFSLWLLCPWQCYY